MNRSSNVEMTPVTPGECELFGSYRVHLGPRMEAAGLGIQFHYNQVPGIHFKTAVADEYRNAILQGLQEGMALRFPDFPETGSVWVVDVKADEVESSRRAFYRAARLVIEQAFSLASTRTT
jgi:hypothetical protein